MAAELDLRSTGVLRVVQEFSLKSAHLPPEFAFCWFHYIQDDASILRRTENPISAVSSTPEK